MGMAEPSVEYLIKKGDLKFKRNYFALNFLNITTSILDKHKKTVCCVIFNSKWPEVTWNKWQR